MGNATSGAVHVLRPGRATWSTEVIRTGHRTSRARPTVVVCAGPGSNSRSRVGIILPDRSRVLHGALFGLQVGAVHGSAHASVNFPVRIISTAIFPPMLRAPWAVRGLPPTIVRWTATRLPPLGVVRAWLPSLFRRAPYRHSVRIGRTGGGSLALDGYPRVYPDSCSTEVEVGCRPMIGGSPRVIR